MTSFSTNNITVNYYTKISTTASITHNNNLFDLLLVIELLSPTTTTVSISITTTTVDS